MAGSAGAGGSGGGASLSGGGYEIESVSRHKRARMTYHMGRRLKLGLGYAAWLVLVDAIRGRWRWRRRVGSGLERRIRVAACQHQALRIVRSGIHSVIINYDRGDLHGDGICLSVLVRAGRVRLHAVGQAQIHAVVVPVVALAGRRQCGGGAHVDVVSGLRRRRRHGRERVVGFDGRGRGRACEGRRRRRLSEECRGRLLHGR